MQATGCILRWTHSDAQLADCLTKDADKARASYELLEQCGFTWRLVYDPKFTASRRRLKQGVTALDDMPDVPSDKEDDEKTDSTLIDPGLSEATSKNPEILQAIWSLYALVEKCEERVGPSASGKQI